MPEDENMWFDERGSEVLTLPECRRLMALAAKQRMHGHLGLCGQGAPVVLPVDFTVDGPDIVLMVGDGLEAEIASHNLVAFQVDGEERGGRWSVLVRGYAAEVEQVPPGSVLPMPRVALPGHRLVRIRSDVETGRRLAERGAESPTPDTGGSPLAT